MEKNIKQRWVIKVGSNVLTRPDGKLDITQMSALVDQIAQLRNEGIDIVLVSSGSVAGGRGELKVEKVLGSVEQRQLFSAIGQAKLINLYYDLFREKDIHIGQVLTMKESFSTRLEYLNQRACMEVMIDNGVLPIVNENDTVSITELMFTDNDELSGLVASMIGANRLIILSNVDGIYNNSENKKEVLSVVKHSEDISQYIERGKSSFGRGGMLTKCRIASKVADEGIEVVIANGRKANILINLLHSPQTTTHTSFLPNPEKVSTMKKWLAHSSSFAKGTIKIFDSTAKALCGDKATSLLLVGVIEIEGNFEEGDIVSVVDEKGVEVALGRAAYHCDEARSLIGQHNVKPLIHYDYLYIEE